MKKTTTTNSKVLKSLTPETTYEYKIRTKCLDGEFGEFTALNTFTTLPLREANMNERSFIELYPNPANGIVTISYETTFVVGSVTLADITGKVVLSTTLTNATTAINISGIPAGFYIVITNFDGNTISEKLIIQ
ncbi:MAG: T9SS type A sorting domain-containing protein [Bacteroidetes bacterium]|nr:T9SS type A sorting domain-containing protein [Bacteroidota bacterium]